MAHAVVPALFTFAQQGPPDEFAGIIGLIICLGFAVLAGVCFWGLISWLIVTPLSSVPAEYRVIPTGHVWLLMIPCFNFIWNFFVFPRVARSFQRYLGDAGISHHHGDCGEQIGVWLSICVVCFFVPLLNYIAMPAALVLLIIYLVKIWGLKGEIERGISQAPRQKPEMDI